MKIKEWFDDHSDEIRTLCKKSNKEISEYIFDRNNGVYNYYCALLVKLWLLGENNAKLTVLITPNDTDVNIVALYEDEALNVDDIAIWMQEISSAVPTPTTPNALANLMYDLSFDRSNIEDMNVLECLKYALNKANIEFFDRTNI